MIKIKISAADERTLLGAKSEAELRGAVDLVLGRIEQAKAEGVFGKPSPEGKSAPGRLTFMQARAIAEREMGDILKIPPYPDTLYYQRVNRNLKIYGIDEEKLLKIVNYAKEHLNPPIGFEFMIAQHERILQGHFNRTPKKGANTGATYLVNNWRKNALPEE